MLLSDLRLFRLREFAGEDDGGAVLAFLMSAVHGLDAPWRTIFERDGNTRTASCYRFWNAVPAILLIIVAMAVAEPL